MHLMCLGGVRKKTGGRMKNNNRQTTNQYYFFVFSKEINIALDEKIFIFTPVIVHDCIQSVGNGQDGTVTKLITDSGLNQLISFHIHCSCGFVQDKYFGFTKKCSCHTQQLSLTNTARIWLLLSYYLIFKKSKRYPFRPCNLWVQIM